MCLLKTSNLGPWKNGVSDQASIYTQVLLSLNNRLSLDELYKTNPGLIYTRISGYGQTGPYSKRPGFASVCEGMGGFRYVNGIPGMPPVRPNLSLGDSLAGLHAAFGVVLGLLSRNKLQNRGQVVDVSIYESVLNMMESIIPEYDRKQVVRRFTRVTSFRPSFMTLVATWENRFENRPEPLLQALSLPTHIRVLEEIG